MTAKDFYRILSLVKGMEWQKIAINTPLYPRSKATLIRGTRHSFHYSPTSAVASAVRREFIDRSNVGINDVLHLDVRTYERIMYAEEGRLGHSKVVRRKLERACCLAA